MSELAVNHEIESGKGRFFIIHDNGDQTELTYTIMSPTLVTADHTRVCPGYEGQGIGLAILEQLLTVASKNGFKVTPLCPYVNAQRRKRPEWAAFFTV